MAKNLSKKFSLLICCLMTMQALRLVISTAGFCAVRFHIDCSLFNIFISRLVNAVLMSQLFGNWLGDLIVFAADGTVKLFGLALANWIECFCFCTALFCIMHTECGHLTGFYWSMVSAYFWWKVGEAPTVSIAAPDATDYYFAGFTLSGVWAACLKAVVMWFVAGTGSKTLSFHSVPLGDVNVSVVGVRSVKTTVDYRAAKWLYITTIVLTALMCLAWFAVAVAILVGKEEDADAKKIVAKALEDKLKGQAKKKHDGESGAGASDNKVALAIAKAGEVSVDTTTGGPKTANFTGATVQADNISVAEAGNQVQITVGKSGGNVVSQGTDWSQQDKDGEQESLETKAKNALQWNIMGETDLMMENVAGVSGDASVTIKLNVKTAGVLKKETNTWMAVLAGIAFGGVLAVPGAMLGAGVGWVFGLFWCCLSKPNWVKAMKWCQLIFGIVGALGGMAAGIAPCVNEAEQATGNATGEDWKIRIWVEAMKWPYPVTETHIKWAPMYGLLVGLALGAMAGAMAGCIVADQGDEPHGALKGTAAGAFFGSFLGLISGEIVNGKMRMDKGEADVGIVVCGFFIVVLGLGTVYSIYPGMAPCSITQFQYFNIIDILILILSSITPLVIMGLDLKDDPNKLALAILEPGGTVIKGTGKALWMGFGVVLLISTNICEILVLDIMHHPFSKMAQKVTNSGWRAVLLTVTMVTSQLVSTGIGFGCVAAGGMFNDGINNAHSTLTLWTTECCGVLGEGYLTELKKYEPGKWPTQGMGKWATYRWWNNKAFGNAWAIWCCIGTTDLRRDIMLCKQ